MDIHHGRYPMNDHKRIMNKYSNSYDKALMIIIFIFFFIRFTLVNFTSIEQYPYFFPDSWDWLSNGLYYAGDNTIMSYRPPIFPLLISLFYKTGLEDLIPIIGQLFSILSALGIYLLSSKLYNKEIGIYATTLFLMSGYILGYSVFILADIITLSMMIFSFYFFVLGINNEKYFILSGVVSGLTFLTQYIGILIIILVIGYLLLNDNIRLVKKKEFIIGIIFYMLISSTWFIYRWLKFGDPFYSTVAHIQLLNLHLNFDDIFYYIWGSVGFISIICIILATLGLLIEDFYKTNKFILFWILIIFSFFTFIYSWNDNRFIMYWTIPILFLSSSGLWKIKRINKSLFFILFVVSFLSIDMIRTPFYNASYIPLIPGYDLNNEIGTKSWGVQSGGYNFPSLEKTDAKNNNFAYLLFYQNRIGATDSIKVIGTSLYPSLVDISSYIQKNSKKDDIIGIWPTMSEGWYTYILQNQINVLTRRHVMLISRPEYLESHMLDFIIIEDILEKVDSFNNIGYETIPIDNKYSILKNTNYTRSNIMKI